MAIGQGEKIIQHGCRKIEETRLHPAKVRVKFIDSQPLAQVLNCSSSSPSSPDVTFDFSDVMTSPTAEQYARQISAESGVDNPFRPDGELSREADTIVSLIKEGKPITSLKGADDVVVDGHLVANGHPKDSIGDGPAQEALVTPTNASGAKVEGKKGTNGNAPGVIDVKHGVINAPSDTLQVEQVTIKKKSKSGCCVVQ